MQRDMDRFCDYAKGKSFALIGVGVSNLPLVSFLMKAGASRVTVRDLKKTAADPEAVQAAKDGGDLILGEGYLDQLNEDVIIRSPGIRPDREEFLKAAEKGSRITCETELFLEFCTAKTFSVTGSDGKTTTTTLISMILQESGWKVLLGGNIGKAMLPQLEECDGEKTCAVMELSSFQLMQCRFSPKVSVVTNLAENHLDWHRGMEEYLEAKKNVFLHQDKNGVLVLNHDNAYTAGMRGNGETRWFSYAGTGEKGCKNLIFENGQILLETDGEKQLLLETDSILLPGKHNVENYMTSIAATLDDADLAAVRHIAETFGGVEHRIERVREVDGVVYYNSSIDSSPSRSEAALNSFAEKVILLAGGYDKHLDYTAFGKVVCEHAKILILCGATADKIEEAVRKANCTEKPEIIHCDDLSSCVRAAKDKALPGDRVLLSPASASFDQFKNFEERGKAFKRMVMEL